MEGISIGRDSGGGDDGNWTRVCDMCQSTACTMSCRDDSAYLCTRCDTRIHAANRMTSRHERVWVCEGCQRAPAAFICKADSASLCANCDAEIHSANSLASRHQRVPVLPIPAHFATELSGIEIESTVTGSQPADENADDADEDEAASWLLLNPVKSNKNQSNELLLYNHGEANEYLDLLGYNNQFNEKYNQQHHQHNGVHQKHYESDSVVPVHAKPDILQLGMGYQSSKKGYSCNSSISQSVSVSSMDVGIVPESAMYNLSVAHLGPQREAIDLFSGPDQGPITPHPLIPMDREARVLRYKEKKKARKFEKTIRYASRKAYAEIRPRIKGRFAKRTVVEVEDDRTFSTSVMPENGYGIVPSL